MTIKTAVFIDANGKEILRCEVKDGESLQVPATATHVRISFTNWVAPHKKR